MTAVLDLTSDLYQSPGARGAFSPHKYQSSPTWTTNQWQTNLNAVLSPAITMTCTHTQPLKNVINSFMKDMTCHRLDAKYVYT